MKRPAGGIPHLSTRSSGGRHGTVAEPSEATRESAEARARELVEAFEDVAHALRDERGDRVPHGAADVHRLGEQAPGAVHLHAAGPRVEDDVGGLFFALEPGRQPARERVRAHREGFSEVRYPDGSRNLHDVGDPSPGEPNVISAPSSS